MKQESKVQVGVKSFIFNTQGQILILKRDLVKYPGANNPWDIPGGRIDAGQTLEENLKREIDEETHLSPQILQILVAQDIIKPEIRVVRLTYISHETLPDPSVRLSDEHSEYKWIELDEMIELDGLDSYVRMILNDKLHLAHIRDIMHKTLDR